MDGLNHTFEFLNGHGALLSFLGIYIGTIFLGNIAAFASLLFAFQGGMGRWGVLSVFVTILAAEASADILWYWTGRGLSTTRLGAFLKRHMPRARGIEEAFEQNIPRLIFLSKFLYSSNFPVIFFIGWSKFRFRTFVRLSILAVFCWMPLLFTLSYLLSSGLTYLHTASVLKEVEWLLLAGVVIFIVIQYIASRFVRKVVVPKTTSESAKLRTTREDV